ncbi:haloacid dehalogenase-like hydrolase [Streptomyces sp. ACA25]|uniref:HAD family hydrolase n=1 Tax=Streptomyces sp. ACA25 TaxID=3022596 RepID=UPI0023072104|nr:HAD family hydrolase [Streptomyces sp. ACA25]MDB1089466.1 haloacid dehalogenase-like hydrolase [Streptomyces sp. ACA25]
MDTRSGHIVWDWNGTLLHDTDVVLEATNASCAEIGLPPLTLEQYRELYCVPVPRFYGKLLGRQPSAEEWEAMDAAFRRHYGAGADRAALAEGAAELLLSWKTGGGTQSVCSLAPHERLVPWLGRLGLDGHFERVDGDTGVTGPLRGKARQMARHLAAMPHVDRLRTVVIGDAADDAAAAAHAGAKAVLYTGGSHSRQGLKRVGVPVVDSLADAVEAAAELVARAGPRPPARTPEDPV